MKEDEIKINYKFRDKEHYLEELYKSPKEAWTKERKLGGNKSTRYVPLFVQQALADVMFLDWDVVDEKYQVVVNEILCTIKITYTPSYPGAEQRIMTGTASKPIQTAADSSVYKFPLGKFTNALEYCAPAARSAAISNAFNTIGNLFGRNLNRKTQDGYSFNKKKEDND